MKHFVGTASRLFGLTLFALSAGCDPCGRLSLCIGPSHCRGTRMHALNNLLPYSAANSPELHKGLITVDREIRKVLGIEPDDTAVGVYDLETGRMAMLRADTPFYAASIPKIAILLSYFETHPEAVGALDATTRHELGLMIKVSSNEMAAKYSEIVGLGEIARVLQMPAYRLYDAEREGGLWVGKHYSKDTERNPEPITGHSHAATVRQLLRYYVMLDRGELVSEAGSRVMREIFESPEIEHDIAKFMKGLAGRDVEVLRKSGTWENWHGDTAIVTGEGRRYIVVALVHHEQGEAYCEQLAPRVDDLMQGR